METFTKESNKFNYSNDSWPFLYQESCTIYHWYLTTVLKTRADVFLIFLTYTCIYRHHSHASGSKLLDIVILLYNYTIDLYLTWCHRIQLQSTNAAQNITWLTTLEEGKEALIRLVILISSDIIHNQSICGSIVSSIGR